MPYPPHSSEYYKWSDEQHRYFRSMLQYEEDGEVDETDEGYIQFCINIEIEEREDAFDDAFMHSWDEPFY